MDNFYPSKTFYFLSMKCHMNLKLKISLMPAHYKAQLMLKLLKNLIDKNYTTIWDFQIQQDIENLLNLFFNLLIANKNRNLM